jgi:hypothetical protein
MAAGDDSLGAALSRDSMRQRARPSRKIAEDEREI